MSRRHTAARGLACAVAVLAATAGFQPVQAAPARPGGPAADPGPSVPATGSAPSREVREDFNGDGFEDLAVAALRHAENTGYVAVVYGSATGPDPATATVIDQATPGVPGEPETGDWFGAVLEARDLDGDGYTDLAVSSTGETSEDPRGGGSVTLLWGSSDGVTGEGAVLIAAEEGDWGVGTHLTGGDFDGDGHADLLTYRAGDGYSVLHGPFGRDGRWAREQQVELEGALSIVAGDMNGDGADDVAAFRSFEEMAEPGELFSGGPDGLTYERRLPKGATGDVADFDGDGYGDLAYREVPGGVVENLPWDSGTVKVMYGGPDGPGARTASFTQATPGVPGANEEEDQFGGTLTAGDVDGDGFADLAAGVPYEDIGDLDSAGSFVVLKGGPKGLSGKGAQAMSQSFAGVPGAAEADDRFGGAVRLRDFDGDGFADLAVTAPDENDGSGAVWSFPGSPAGVTTDGVRSFGPAVLGGSVPEAGLGLRLSGTSYAPLWQYE
ncbi:FG-GAP and VCBS repeat-containing protein [Streptomyces sp. DSM 42041]|uniref:FG-GAP and VCBS repeat-containing protein n=1 Tax=Streptomyces hazeniae TaxID=3075538 RepID=A0ABU2NV54_9ACTN|nr:FG-GAP and VCBS repeat-containing protein [Streptomyces sp. DSM 42041]MDT0380629.1 FG-GAP and VCBS repeat-containing protein [Streptomyces sp. DSM 42041]